jgi:ABC-type nitrate/sulfonate/bicarbonate transport system substrate-binding protein
MTFPRQPDKLEGWTLEYKWLESLVKEANGRPSDDIQVNVSMEQAEQVLLAAEDWVNEQVKKGKDEN